MESIALGLVSLTGALILGAIAERYRRIAARLRGMLQAGGSPDLRRQLVESDNEKERLRIEALRKQSYETDFETLRSQMTQAAAYRDRARRDRAALRLARRRLSSENRQLRGSLSQARVDLSLIRERLERLMQRAHPTRLSRIRSALQRYRASAGVVELLGRLDRHESEGETKVTPAELQPPRRRSRTLLSDRPSRWDRPRSPWRSRDSRAPAPGCP